MTPAEVDDLELWQIAAFLGVHRPPAPPGEEDGTLRSGHDPAARRKAQNLQLARQRIAAAKGEAPPVQAAAPGLEEASTAMRLSQAMRGKV